MKQLMTTIKIPDDYSSHAVSTARNLWRDAAMYIERHHPYLAPVTVHIWDGGKEVFVECVLRTTPVREVT